MLVLYWASLARMQTIKPYAKETKPCWSMTQANQPLRDRLLHLSIHSSANSEWGLEAKMHCLPRRPLMSLDPWRHFSLLTASHSTVTSTESETWTTSRKRLKENTCAAFSKTQSRTKQWHIQILPRYNFHKGQVSYRIHGCSMVDSSENCWNILKLLCRQRTLQPAHASVENKEPARSQTMAEADGPGAMAIER